MTRQFALLLILVLTGCGILDDAPIDPPPTESARVKAKYGAIIARLSVSERGVFDDIETDAARDAYLEEIGAAAEARIHGALREGMNDAEVGKKLGSPEDRETEWSGGVSFEYWTYREPVRRFVEVKSVLQFRDSKLIGWRVVRKNGGE